MSAPLVTLIVTPRERYDLAPASYSSLRAHTSPEFPVVYVDACCPRAWARKLNAFAAAGQLRLIRPGFHVSQQEAFNLALPGIESKYIAFLDYESTYTPGWLEKMIACAEETGAAAVMPLLLEDDAEGGWRVHNAGGDCGVVEKDGQLWYREVHFLKGEPVPDHLVRTPTGLVEYHALLVRREALEKVGPFDEHYWPALDYTDFSLQLRASGGTLWLEPASVIKHHVLPAVGPASFGLFMNRWSDRWVLRGQRRFAEKWGVRFPSDHAPWYRHHRRSCLHPIREGVGRRLGWFAGKAAYRLLWPGEALVCWLVQAWTRVDDRERKLEALGAWRGEGLDRADIETLAEKIFRHPEALSVRVNA